MNVKTLTNSVSKSLNVIGRELKKHSPEILAATGVVGVVATTVTACQATTKVDEILDDTKEKVKDIKEVENNEKYADKYTHEDAVKDLTIVYTQTGVKLIKLYAPSIILGVASITSLLASNNILRKRNVALTASLSAIDGAFRDYRSNVIERFGDTVDKELRYNLRYEEVEETVTDDKGKEKKVKKTIPFADSASCYARFFENRTRNEDGSIIRNPNWEDDPSYNVMFLNAQQAHANDLLKSRYQYKKNGKSKPGIVFLNEVYEMLGFPKSKAGQIAGWMYDPNNQIGDDVIDFGIFAGGADNYNDFIYGDENAILLDFNVIGNVWQYM